MGHGCHGCGCPNGCECSYRLDGAAVKVKTSKQMTSLNMVKEFHETFGQAVVDVPDIDNYPLYQLRLDLLNEELSELEEALNEKDEVAVLDALTDLQYVLDGAYLALGFHPYKDAALREVHRSNMSKLGPDGKPIYREDGKVLKGPGYSPPDLVGVLRGIND